jgi:hypothetical protein
MKPPVPNIEPSSSFGLPVSFAQACTSAHNESQPIAVPSFAFMPPSSLPTAQARRSPHPTTDVDL